MKSKLTFAISALVWALILMAAYVVSMHAQTNTTANQPALKRAKLPEAIRLYDLRHSCATILLEQGEHPKVVRLGHSSAAITLDTYSHVAPTMQEKASAKIANEMYGRRKSHSSHTKPKTGGNREK